VLRKESRELSDVFKIASENKDEKNEKAPLSIHVQQPPRDAERGRVYKRLQGKSKTIDKKRQKSRQKGVTSHDALLTHKGQKPRANPTGGFPIAGPST